MIRMKSVLMMSMVALLCVGTVYGAEEAKKKARGKKGEARVFAMLKKVELSEEQTEKVAKIKKEFGEKLAAATKSVGMTKEQRESRMTAMKDGKEKGLKGKELREFVTAKSPLTDEQQAAMKEMNALNLKVRGMLAEILTEEQRETLKLNVKKGAKKKKDA